MSKLINLSGQRFGKLSVIQFVGRVNKHSMFLCLCDCGKDTIVTSNNLRRSHTISCGCESSKNTIGERTATHKLRNHPLYISWIGMRNRCYNPKNNRFEHYGGKGISVCDDWRDDFKSFYKWAKSHGWRKGLSIDRISNDKDYCPDNCKFSSISEQNRNRTSNVKLTIDGQTKILVEWAELAKIKYETLRARLKKGWTAQEVVFGKPNNR